MNTGPTDTCTALALIALMFSMYCDSVEIIANSCCVENIVTHNIIVGIVDTSDITVDGVTIRLDHFCEKGVLTLPIRCLIKTQSRIS